MREKDFKPHFLCDRVRNTFVPLRGFHRIWPFRMMKERMQSCDAPYRPVCMYKRGRACVLRCHLVGFVIWPLSGLFAYPHKVSEIESHYIYWLKSWTRTGLIQSEIQTLIQTYLFVYFLESKSNKWAFCISPRLEIRIRSFKHEFYKQFINKPTLLCVPVSTVWLFPTNSCYYCR